MTNILNVFLIITLSLSLNARENPFEAIVSQEDGPAIIKKRNIKHFAKDKVKPPEGARILKDITVEYQNLDGSISKQKLKIDKHLDWNSPIHISQTKTKKQKNVKQTIKTTKFLSAVVEPNKIFLETDDKFLRDFFIIKPFRIVVDFKRTSSFKSREYAPKIKPFKTVAIGNHKDYYRVVITVDGRYAYDVNVYENGVLIHLN